MKRFVLTVPERSAEFSGDMLATALRRAADSFDDETQWFDDPADKSGFDTHGTIFGRDVSTIFKDGETVGTWEIQLESLRPLSR